MDEQIDRVSERVWRFAMKHHAPVWLAFALACSSLFVAFDPFVGGAMVIFIGVCGFVEAFFGGSHNG